MVRLADGEDRRMLIAHPDGGRSSDSAVDVYLECGESSTENNVMVEVIAQLVDKAFFAQLRTAEQLGYIVGAGVATNHAAAALVFRVQSVKSTTQVGVSCQLSRRGAGTYKCEAGAVDPFALHAQKRARQEPREQGHAPDE